MPASLPVADAVSGMELGDVNDDVADEHQDEEVIHRQRRNPQRELFKHPRPQKPVRET